MAMPPLPSRVCRLDQARARFGDYPDRLLPALWRVDPLADAVVADFAEMPKQRVQATLDHALRQGISAVDSSTPASLHRLFEQLDHVPAWVDWAQLNRAGQLLFRTGLFGGLVLAFRSLALGYCAPAGNKPLMMGGQLKGKTRVEAARMRRRLGETGKFVVDVCRPSGMRRYAPGFAATVKVRLMHAQIRRLIDQSGRWQPDAWGAPINQHDMVATTLLFSHAFIGGLQRLGVIINDEEIDAYLQLWRYNGWVIGVEPELLVSTEREAERMAACIEAVQAAPDDDARTLVWGLLEGPLLAAETAGQRQQAERRLAIGQALLREMLGSNNADHLGLSNHYRWLIPSIRTTVHAFEQTSAWIPGARRRAIERGQRYWDNVVEAGLRGGEALFVLPTALDRPFAPAEPSPNAVLH